MSSRGDHSGERDAAAVSGVRWCAPLTAMSPAERDRYFLHEKQWRHAPVAPATAAETERARAIVAGRFTYIGEAYDLGRAHSWGRNPSRDKEWLIAHHKHYFSLDLVQAFAATGEQAFLDCWCALIGSWLDTMGTGAISASDAQVEAKRVESWIASLVVLNRAPHPREIAPGLLTRLVRRISHEAGYIARHLRPSRNHRTFQLYAVALAGLLLDEVEGHAALAELGVHELTRNLLDDFLPCGVHVERSTHYHNITLETALAFVDLARRNDRTVDAALVSRLGTALDFAAATQLPDGGMLLINDSDAQDHREMFRAGAALTGEAGLLWVGERGGAGRPPGWRSREFGGYLVLRDGWGTTRQDYPGCQHVFLDCAPLGEGSHSHYDLLNLCWFAGGRPVVVDPGRFTYDAEPGPDGIDWRRAFKSTRSHNTVEIDGCDQTRYLSKAMHPPAGVERYDKRIHAAKHGPEVAIAGYRFEIGPATDWACATAISHEYAPRHSRVLVFMQRQYVVVLDQVDGGDGREHSAVLRYHLAAGWQDRVVLEEARGHHRFGPGGAAPDWSIHVLSDAGATAGLESGWISESYGVKTPAPVLAVAARGHGTIAFASVLLPAATGRESIVCRSISHLDLPCGSVGLAIALDIGGQSLLDTVAFTPGGAIRADRHDRAGMRG